jgi:zinc ribbon protein
MYCHACGQRVPAEAAFCPSCGTSLRRIAPRRQTIHPVWIVLTMLFFPPIGFILMWTSTDWPSDVKWALSGIFFPPFWLRFLWKVDWLPYVAGALLAGFVLDKALFGPLSAGGAIAIVLVIAMILLVTFGVQRSREEPQEPDLTPLQRAIEEKLDLSNEIIARIEADRSLDLVPARLPIHERYMEALNLRSQGQERFAHAAAPKDLIEANMELEGALNGLCSVQRELSEDGHRDTPDERLK